MPPAKAPGESRRRAPRGSKGAPKPPGGGLTYAAAGVDIDAGDRATDLIQSHMRRTFGPRVIDNPGGFAGLLRLDYNERLFKRNFRDPVLVACTDSVGSKVMLAVEMDVHDTIGQDCVAMNVNDMIVQGAEPLLFLDYIGIHKVVPEQIERIVRGVADGCRLAGCALIGGETCEMPDVYAPGDYDLAGFAVGVVELKRAINPLRVEPGDVVLALASSGIHSNGYTLVRRIVKEAGLGLDRVYPELGGEATERRSDGVTKGKRGTDQIRNGQGTGARGSAGSDLKAQASGLTPASPPTLGRVLLTPTRIYVRSIVTLLRAYKVKKVVSGMAHITGGGLAGNLERALNPRVDAVIDRGSWEVPPVFRFLQERGGVEEEEMRRVFNMGVGYCLVVRPTFANAVRERLESLGEAAWVIGRIRKGKGRVVEQG